MRDASKVQIRSAGAPADFPLLGDQLETWRRAFAESEWMPWLIIGLAAFLRFFLLGMKPPHFDEGINGWFVDQLLKTGFYRYDPTNYHGPLHFYVLLLSQTLFGRNLIALRLPVVLVSIGCVWLTLKYEPFVGRTASRLAALAMAVSPGFVFYGRYSIHEVWILFFTMLFIYGLFGLWKFGTAKSLWSVGMGLTGMILSKETYVLHVLCAIIAVPVCAVSNYFSEMENRRGVQQTWNYLDLAFVVGTGVALIVAFYSGFFFHWNGVKDLFAAYKPWFETGSQGHGHEKPWYYWLGLIARYEWPVLAALVFCLLNLKTRIPVIRWLAIWAVISTIAGQAILWILVHFQLVGWTTQHDNFWLPVGLGATVLLGLGSISISQMPLRYLAIYGLGTLFAYSYVKYKTPWCIISFVWPFLFTFSALLTVTPMRFAGVTYRWIALVLFGLLAYAIYYDQAHNVDHVWPYAMVLGLVALLVVLASAELAKLVTFLLLLWSLGHCIWLNYFRCTTDTEPYVYVQTYNDIDKFTDPILQIAHADPRAYQFVGHIIRGSPYPLPWILGEFGRVGYYEKDNMPDPLDADFLLVQDDKIQTVESKLHGSYYTVPITIRPYQDPSKAYFSAKFFKTFFPGKGPDFTGPKPTPSQTPAPTATPNQ